MDLSEQTAYSHVNVVKFVHFFFLVSKTIHTVHFCSKKIQNNRKENWGKFQNWAYGSLTTEQLNVYA